MQNLRLRKTKVNTHFGGKYPVFNYLNKNRQSFKYGMEYEVTRTVSQKALVSVRIIQFHKQASIL